MVIILKRCEFDPVQAENLVKAYFKKGPYFKRRRDTSARFKIFLLEFSPFIFLNV